jgi:MSHA biogenesis protein MshI
LSRLAFLWPKSKPKGVTVGIELLTDTLALVANEIIGDTPHLKMMTQLHGENSTELEKALSHWVLEHKLTKCPCHVVLGADFYQMLLVEPPEVPETELRSAMRWRLKDLINFPVDQASLEIFSLPTDVTRNNKKLVYVVICETKKLLNVIACIKTSGMQLESIDIGELAMRNLALALAKEQTSERGIAIARIRKGVGSFYVYREGNLYLGRNFSLAYQGGLLDPIPEDSLALELQRSLDYYERQMGQAPPSALYVCGDYVTEDKIGPVLRAGLAVRVNWLNPASTVKVDAKEYTDVLAQKCLAAIGGALRAEMAS